MTKQLTPTIRAAHFTIYTLLFLAPFGPFLTIWLSSALGHGSYGLLRLWKELLTVMLVGITLSLYYTHRTVGWRLHSPVMRGIAVYGALIALVTVIGLSNHSVTLNAAIHGTITDTMFLVFFVCCFVIASIEPLRLRLITKLVLSASAIVVALGLAQHWLLPYDHLKHFGYNRTTLPATATIDNKPEYSRIQSTIGGPNVLGAYLIIITALCVSTLAISGFMPPLVALLLACLVALFFTGSRASWGATFTACLCILITRKSKLLRIGLASAGVIAVLLVGVGLMSHNSRIQNILLHTDTSATNVSSNVQHTTAFRIAIQDIWHHPFGQGAGSAGPVSGRNAGKIKLAENYYLQIAQEFGVLGLAAFLTMCAAMLWQLWRSPSSMARNWLMASFIGLSIANLATHIWAESVIAYLWWGIAGVVLAQTAYSKDSSSPDNIRDQP